MARNPNTTISYGFRTAVGLHCCSLFVLIFLLRGTLVGGQHSFVAVALNILMLVAVALFAADMGTRQAEDRQYAKLVDIVVGCIWFLVVGYLLINSWRAGEILLR